ncbi:MAG: RnfABCDGE type electron transport complex subunit G [Tannerella sp.]|jgi:electron transport complex protein RnfG|nr:RnfABCDGE type electron transport complex subunit G [Tannerella sp.]
MAKLKSDLTNMVSVLTGISLFAAIALAMMYSVTKAPIEAAKTAKAQDAIREVLPPFERLDSIELIEIENVGALAVHKAYDGAGQFVGAAVESFSNNAFNGTIKVMVGFDRDGNITNYSVLEQQETPGLGTKMTDWFKPQSEIRKSLVETIFGFQLKTEARKSSVIGKNPAKDNLTVSRDGGEIDGITAATISSRAFLHAVSVAYAAYANNPDAVTDGNSGATTATDTDKHNRENEQNKH